jgi:hypothetical protein
MVPVVKTGAELPQIFTDLRLSETLDWKEGVIIAEEHTSKFLFFLGMRWNEVSLWNSSKKHVHLNIISLDKELFDGLVDSLSRPVLKKNPLALTVVKLHGPVALRYIQKKQLNQFVCASKMYHFQKKELWKSIDESANQAKRS